MAKYTCECGKTINYNHRWKHFETKFHINSPLVLEAKQKKHIKLQENITMSVAQEKIKIEEDIEIFSKFYSIDDETFESMFDEIVTKQPKETYIDLRNQTIEYMRGVIVTYDLNKSIEEFGNIHIFQGNDMGIGEIDCMVAFQYNNHHIFIDKLTSFIREFTDDIERFYDLSVRGYVLK